MAHTTVTRDRIIAAASAAIIDGGLRSATTREVARRAGLSEGSIYIHFASKQDLLAAVVRERLTLPAVHAMTSGPPDAPPRDVLVALVTQMLQQFKDAVPLLAALMSEPSLGDLVLRETPPSDGFPGIAGVADYLRRQQRAGTVGPHTDAQMMARLLFAGTFHHAFLARAFGEEKLRPRGAQFVRRLVDAVLSSAGSGASPAKPGAAARR